MTRKMQQESDLISGSLRNFLTVSPASSLSKKARKRQQENVDRRIADVSDQDFFSSCRRFGRFPAVWEEAGMSFMSEVEVMLGERGVSLLSDVNTGVVPSGAATSARVFGVKENSADGSLVDVCVVVDGGSGGLLFTKSVEEDLFEERTVLEPTSKTKERICRKLESAFSDEGFHVRKAGVSGWTSSDAEEISCVVTVERW